MALPALCYFSYWGKGATSILSLLGLSVLDDEYQYTKPNITWSVSLQGYDVRNILLECELSEEEWKLTETCLKRKYPEYEAKGREHLPPYKSDLMLNLNEELTKVSKVW